MKLLLLTPQLPYPPHQGTTIRNYNVIACLAEHHDITLLSFGTPEELECAEPLKAACRRIEVTPYPTRSMSQRLVATFTSPQPDMALRLKSAAMHSKFAALLQNETFDVVQIEGIEMARYWAPSSARSNKVPKLVFDDHNAEYMLQRTAFESDAHNIRRWHGALYSYIQWRKLTRFERRIGEMANAIVACSQTDAAAIAALGTKPRIYTIPNGVDTLHFVPSDEASSKSSEPTMIFAGKMDFRPNIDAMSWFCEDILPLIRAELPQAQMVIVGQKPSPRVQALKREGVQVTGWVPDTRPYISDAAIYVVPLRMGSGTRLKVLEAMAMGRAIVSTARGVEGIDVRPDCEVVVADSPRDFATAVVALLRNPERRHELGRAARALVEAKYDWRAIVPAFERVYQEIV